MALKLTAPPFLSIIYDGNGWKPDGLAWRFRIIGIVAFCICAVFGMQAQVTPRSQVPGGVRPPHNEPSGEDYNLKWKNLTARLSASVVMEYYDNLNLSEDKPVEDMYISPMLGVGFLWQLSQNTSLQFDMGVGYRWYLNNPSVNMINMAPNSRLDYRIRIKDLLELSLYDRFTVIGDAIGLPDAAGQQNIQNFQRFNNTTGITANWNLVRQVSLQNGYSFTMDRSMSGTFKNLDRNDHSFFTGVFSPTHFWPALTVGMNGSYSITDYLQRQQNNSHSWTIGPVAQLQLTRSIFLDASVGYSVSNFDNSGSIQDTSDFKGITYQGGIRHQVNRVMNHQLRAGRSVSLGFSSNYTKTDFYQYSVTLEMIRKLKIDTSFSYEQVNVSGIPGEDAQRYIFYLGTGYAFAKNWNAAIAYQYAQRESDVLGRSYKQNRVTLTTSRSF